MKSLHDAPSTPHHPPRMQARLVVGMLASALIAAGCTKRSANGTQRCRTEACR